MSDLSFTVVAGDPDGRNVRRYQFTKSTRTGLLSAGKKRGTRLVVTWSLYQGNEHIYSYHTKAEALKAMNSDYPTLDGARSIRGY